MTGAKDDGKGIQIDKLKEKAKSLGRWSDDQIKKWNREKITNLIFESGISTFEKSNIVAGRGVGMQIIKQKVDKRSGRLAVDFEEGKYCEFTISLPLLVNEGD